MNKSPHDVYQKYYPEGRILIKAEALPKFEPAVIRQLRAPGMMTLESKFDFRRFVKALVDEGIPQEDAQIIARSIMLIEDEAYCRPKEPGSF